MLEKTFRWLTAQFHPFFHQRAKIFTILGTHLLLPSVGRYRLERRGRVIDAPSENQPCKACFLIRERHVVDHQVFARILSSHKPFVLASASAKEL